MNPESGCSVLPDSRPATTDTFFNDIRDIYVSAITCLIRQMPRLQSGLHMPLSGSRDLTKALQS